MRLTDPDNCRLAADDGTLRRKAQAVYDHCQRTGMRPRRRRDALVLEGFALACALEVFGAELRERAFHLLIWMERQRVRFRFALLVAELERYDRAGFCRMARLRVPGDWRTAMIRDAAIERGGAL